ncbi:tetratricopeptide repeat protein [Phormidesmis sp. 146-12]
MRASQICGLLISVLLSGVFNPRPLLSMTAVQYRDRGLQLREQGQLATAIASLQKAVELEPANVSGRVSLGWTLHLAKRDSEAAAMLEQTIAFNPFDVQTFNALGIVYLVSDRLPDAVITHTWASFLAPQNEIAPYNLSLAFWRLKAYDWAIASAKRAAELEPNNPHPWVALAIAHWSNGERKLAQQAYQQAIAQDGRYGDRDFLKYLDEAGFSASQIAVSREVLAAL